MRGTARYEIGVWTEMKPLGSRTAGLTLELIASGVPSGQIFLQLKLQIVKTPHIPVPTESEFSNTNWHGNCDGAGQYTNVIWNVSQHAGDEHIDGVG